MNKKIQTLFSIAIFCFFLLPSCSKEDQCLDATVRFSNNSENPYNLFIDGLFERELDGNTFIEIDLLEGQHSVRAEQVSGFILFPTERETILNVFGCQELGWVFP